MIERKIHQEKFAGRPEVGKTTLMYTADKLCDGCDETRHCAVLYLLSGGVSILCEDCIVGILESLNPSLARDMKINEILKD